MACYIFKISKPSSKHFCFWVTNIGLCKPLVSKICCFDNVSIHESYCTCSLNSFKCWSEKFDGHATNSANTYEQYIRVRLLFHKQFNVRLFMNRNLILNQRELFCWRCNSQIFREKHLRIRERDRDNFSTDKGYTAWTTF